MGVAADSRGILGEFGIDPGCWDDFATSQRDVGDGWILTQDCAALVLHSTNEDLFAGTPAWAIIRSTYRRKTAAGSIDRGSGKTVDDNYRTKDNSLSHFRLRTLACPHASGDADISRPIDFFTLPCDVPLAACSMNSSSLECSPIRQSDRHRSVYVAFRGPRVPFKTANPGIVAG